MNKLLILALLSIVIIGCTQQQAVTLPEEPGEEEPKGTADRGETEEADDKPPIEKEAPAEKESESIEARSCERPYMGFPFNHGFFASSHQADYPAKYNENADMFLLHYAGTIPWEALKVCDDMDACSVDDAEFQKSIDGFKAQIDGFAKLAQDNKRENDGIIYLSLTPMNNDRNGVIPNFPPEAALGFTPPGVKFGDSEVRRLYKKYVDYMVDKFEPDYLSQGVEVNMYANVDPDDFANLISLLVETRSSKTTTIGPTFQWEFFKFNWDKEETRLLMQDLLDAWPEIGEGYAISTYPHIFAMLDGSEPMVSRDDYNFEEYGLDLSDRPLVISESGSRDEDQVEHLETLFSLADDYDLIAVAMWSLDDDDEYFRKIPDVYPNTVFKDIGLFDDDAGYAPHAGYEIWKNTFDCS